MRPSDGGGRFLLQTGVPCDAAQSLGSDVSSFMVWVTGETKTPVAARVCVFVLPV